MRGISDPAAARPVERRDDLSGVQAPQSPPRLIAGFQPLRSVLTRQNSLWRACGDDIAGFQRSVSAHERDNGCHTEYHVGGRRMLFALSVDPAAYAEILRIRDVVGRYEKRTKRQETSRWLIDHLKDSWEQLSGPQARTVSFKLDAERAGPRHLTPAGRSVFYDLFPLVAKGEPIDDHGRRTRQTEIRDCCLLTFFLAP